MTWPRRPPWALLAVALCLIGAAVAPPGRAQERAEPPRAPRAAGVPVLRVLTFGPGDHAFAKFGHDALWVHDPRQPANRRDLVFNYGTFRFDSPWLIVDFLKGRLSYWLSVSSLSRTVSSYREANRSVRAQELALSPSEALAITAFLHENARPENASYRYDYYRDNCATRIRDVLDRHLGGRLRAAATGPAEHTYREHTRRLTMGSPELFFALDLALGPLVDRPVTQWEEMFLPARVEAKLEQVESTLGGPLVRRRFSLFDAERDPAPEVPPGFPWGWLLGGAAVGSSLGGASFFRQRWARAWVALGLGVQGLVAGVLGVLLLVLWLLTDHEVAHWNQNVLLCVPWALLLPAFARDFARPSPRHARWMLRLVGAAALSALLALALRLGLPSSQHTGPALAVFLPAWLGAGLAVWNRAGRPLPRWLPSTREGTVGSIPPARTSRGL